MLVLTRKIGESIVLPALGVTVTVLAGDGGSRVRLGVDAPRGTVVHRKEVWARIEAEKNASSGDKVTG
jgi:carbon storage regulator